MSEPTPRRLHRSSSDRMLVGVCGGLGQYFSVDPLILRIAFAVSIFFGGLGLVLYLVLALLVPVDDAPDGKPLISMGRPEAVALIVALAILVIAIPLFGALFAWVGDPGILWAIALAVLLVAGVSVWRDRGRGRDDQPLAGGGADEVTPTAPAPAGRPQVSDADPTQPTQVHEPAAAVEPKRRSNLLTVLLICGTALFSIAAFFAAILTVGFGLGVLVAAVIVAGGLAVFALAFGGGTAGRWLIAPLIAMVLGAGAAEAGDLNLEGGVGEEVYRPRSAAAIPTEGYRLGAGHLAVDLRDIPWRRGQVLSVKADAGIGFVEVSVPRNVCVIGSAKARAGYVAFVGDEDDGFDALAEGRGNPHWRPVSGERPRTQRTGRDGARLSRPPILDLTAAVDMGAVVVVNDGSRLSDDRWDDHDSISTGDLARMRALNQEACAG